MGATAWQPPDVATSGRIGVRVTAALVVLVVVDLVVSGIVPGVVAVIAIAVVATLGLVGRRIDWDSMAERSTGTWIPYLWTVSGLVAWAVYVGAVGSQSSDHLVLVLAVAVIASAVGYPLRGQIVMYTATAAALVAGRVGAGTTDLIPTVVLDVGLLLLLAAVSATVSIHLRRARRTAAAMRAAAERRSGLIRAVASLSRLDPQEAMNSAVAALIGLGFDAAAVVELEGGRLRPRAHRGFAEERPPRDIPEGEGVVGRVLARCRTIVVDDYRSDPAALPYRPTTGSVVAAPIIIDGAATGAVIGVRREKGPVPADQVEVLETIASQSGRVLANARRFATEHEMGLRLAELNHMKSELLANVSSELRAPLTVVQGAAETLRRHPDLLDGDDAFLGRLNSQADRLAGMIHDLLDFTRLQAGRYDLTTGHLDIEAIVREAAHPSVVVSTEGHTCVDADERLLRRAIGHLLDAGERAFLPTDVHIRGDEHGMVEVEIQLRRDRDRTGRGTIAVSLASEILASHGAALELAHMGPGRAVVRFSLPAATGSVPSGAEMGQ